MILSTAEKKVLAMLENCDGPMPVDWLKPHYRAAIPRLRELGMLRKRDPEWAHLTKLGRASVGPSVKGAE
ncbi:hypothetical protein [Bradyrhizobium elkanii]|jgi:hypothetical protein|uniref:hypothetical protein n=1 Tax=Bradyrhizobium elkanii TaxID=29448 RepID=UPI00272BACBB|nr:hypothetical protein [Bradyrhizobium elkanii]WLA80377.1 hypothetical protein QNJ99_34080 [Bradyrhizobium elkanii]